MNVVTIWEEDGTKTRLSVGADNIAFEVATFYRKIIKLNVLLESGTEPIVVEDEAEIKRADRYMNEWRLFGKSLGTVK